MRHWYFGLSVWHPVIAAAILSLTVGRASAQSPLAPVDGFPLGDDPLTIRQHAAPRQPFTVAGECGMFVGQQDGSFESWIFPVKLLSHFHIDAEVDGYTVPIDVNSDAAEIEVAPGHTTITYSHIAFTLRETLFATPCAANGTGVMALFQVDAIRPVTLTFSFTPEVKRMWPAPNANAPSPEWVKQGASGYYVLHTDFSDLGAAIAIPGAEPGVLAPYQERPQFWPLQFVLRFDPKRDAGRFFPLLMAVGNDAAAADPKRLAAQLEPLDAQVPALYQKTAHYYAHFFDHRLTVDTPDVRFNQAMRWAEISIDQLRLRHGDEVGLVAGFYSSGDSTRPGFGWFFGRDTLFTLYAVNSYGDFALTRQALKFLLARQRDDGKIMHEYSQTADLVDWQKLPYEYAAADATPLLLMQMADYAHASGDRAFIEQHWPQIQKAWQFEITHDSDGDGLYDNAQGTGWVESWPTPQMPHQEIYIACLDQQASTAYAQLARLMDKPDEAAASEARARKLAAVIEHEYAGPMYAFSRNEDGSLDKTATIYPAIAWWDGTFALKQAGSMFQRWASHEFSTDWGTRDVGEQEPYYDPISYHQGSVWPLFTGWTSLAEYRTGHALSAYAHLRQNAGLTWTQDPGAVTELLSGAYFVPFGRSTTHQLWSSAMVLTPALRGLFGLSYDAAGDTLTVNPHLPAQWDHAVLDHVPAGNRSVRVEMHRDGRVLRVHAAGVRLAGPAGASLHAGELTIPLPEVEVGIPAALPLPGARTAQLKVLAEQPGARSLTLTLEAQGGSTEELVLRRNGSVAGLHVEGATAEGDLLRVVFAPGQGYRQQTVRLRW